MRPASTLSALIRGPWVHVLQIIAKFPRFAVNSAGCFLTIALIFAPTASAQTGTPSFQILVNPATFGTNTQALGLILYTKYSYYFQAAGLVLLVAMIGAIVLTLRHKPYVRRQDISVQVARNPATAIEIRKVQPGQGI